MNESVVHATANADCTHVACRVDVASSWPVDLDHYEFTTGVSIVPDTFPFPDCHGHAGPYNCTGVLV